MKNVDIVEAVGLVWDFGRDMFMMCVWVAIFFLDPENLIGKDGCDVFLNQMYCSLVFSVFIHTYVLKTKMVCTGRGMYCNVLPLH